MSIRTSAAIFPSTVRRCPWGFAGRVRSNIGDDTDCCVLLLPVIFLVRERAPQDSSELAQLLKRYNYRECRCGKGVVEGDWKNKQNKVDIYLFVCV